MPTRKTDETDETDETEEEQAAEAEAEAEDAQTADESGELTEEPSSDAPLDEDDGGRARRRELLAARRAELGDEELALSHPVLRGPAAFTGLTRRQVEAIANPTDRDLALALWEEANEAHLREGYEEPERDARKQPPSQLPPDFYTRS